MKQLFNDSQTEMYKVTDDVSGEMIASAILTRKPPADAAALTPPEPSAFAAAAPGVNPEF